MNTTDDSSDKSTQRYEIRRLAEEFAQSLRSGGQPRIDEFLARIDPSLQDNLREELVGEEFAYRFGDATQNGKLRYRPIALLGKGAFGEVYKAVDEELGRNVALKVLLRTEDAAKQRFLAEAGRQANLRKHEYLVAVFDSGTLPKGHSFAVMEYFDGGTLRAELDSQGKLDVKEAAQLVEQIAQAVAAVHQGTPALVHRDLKPENILLDSAGNAHVADFGIAAAVIDLHSGTAGAGGTISYMSPEQATAFRPGMTPAPVDTRSDIWALGVILYELVTGKHPFSRPGDNREEILEAIIRYEPPQMRDLCPDVLPELERLVGECLKKDVTKRILSAKDIAIQLRRWLESVSAIPEPLDFSAWLVEARWDFSDRPWLFDEVDAWPAHQNERLLLLTGELGSGKSAFLAELIHRNPQRILAWHLCRHDWPESRSAAKFVRSLAGMLAARVESYRSKLANLPLEALRIGNCEQDAASAFESAVVTPLTKSPPPGDGVWFVVVDALDEADPPIARLLAQWERRTPSWLRIVASARRGAIDSSVFSGKRVLDIDRDNANHVEDVRHDILRFLRRRLNQPNLAERLQQASVPAETVANKLVEKSQANFLYSVEALVAVECDLIKFTELDTLPPGLTGLYAAFFRRQWPDKKSFAVVRPILEALVAAQQPLSEDLLTSATHLDSYQLNDSLRQLAQYLDRERSGLRHLAVKEWLTSTQDLYRVDLNKGHRRLADYCAKWLSLPASPGREYARRYQLTHLAALDDRQGIDKLLFSTPWVHHRLREDTERGDSLEFLLSDLRLSLAHLGCGRSAQIRSLMDFLIGWGPAIQQDTALIDRWWTAAGTVTRPFPQRENSGGSGGARLLVPITGPSISDCSYPIPWPANPRFHGAVCESTDERSSRLVFVASLRGGPGDLLVYKDDGGHYTRERFIRLPDGEGVFHLAGLPYPGVAALVRMPDGGCELRIVDISTGLSRTVLSDDRIITCAAVAANHLSLIVILGVPSEEGPASCLLRAIDVDGHVLAERELPFVITNSGRLDVVPFAPNAWGIVGQPSASQRDELALYRLTSESGSFSVDEFASRVTHVNGACRLPEDRLAVCHRSAEGDSSFLSIIEAAGTVATRIPLYNSPHSHSTGRGYNNHHDIYGQFLLDAFPAGWHQEYGIVLCGEYENYCHGYCYAVQPEPEAIPRPLPRELAKRLDTGDSTTTREQVVGLSNERTLFVFSTGADAIGPGLSDESCIEGGGRTEITTEILGCRADGQVVVCDGYVNPDNAWSREDKRLAQPPFGQTVSTRPLAPGFLRITRCGAELSLSTNRRTLEWRQGDGEVARWGAPAGEKISDGDVADNGQLLVAATRNKGRPSAWLHQVGRNSAPIRLYNGEREPRILQTAGRLAIVERLDWCGDPGNRKVVADLRNNRKFSFDGGEMRMLALPGESAILISASSLSEFGIAQVFLYAPEANPPWGGTQHLGLSPQTLLHERIQQDGEWLLGFVSIVKRDWKWELCAETVRFVPLSQELISQRSRQIQLTGEVSCWAQHEEHLVLGYASGRIETRWLSELAEVAAVGYTASRPNALVVASRPEGTFVAVSAGDLIWFGLTLTAKRNSFDEAKFPLKGPA